MSISLLSSRTSSRASALGLLAAAMACTSSPSQPATSSSDGSLTPSIAAGRPSAPANGAQIGFGAQPIALTILNAVVTETGSGPITYTFEVATDASFLFNKAQTKDGVPQGTGGQTSVVLDALPGGKDYFWHARAQGGGTTGVFGATFKFTVGAPVTLSAPVAIAPLTGAQTSGSPSFTVANATRTGAAGTTVYRFDIADNPGFSTPIVSVAVAEGPGGRTTFAPSSDLPANKLLYWRATAIDSRNAVTSAASAPQSFTTSQTIDLAKVVYLLGPNLSTWKQTGTITSVEQDGNVALGGPMCISFTDPGWPDTPWIYAQPGDPPGFSIYGNQWYFANIGGIWYGGPGEWLYRGAATCKAGQGTTTIGRDSGFGPPFSSWVPKPGELVGYAVSASARALPQMSTVQERTNVVLVPWHDSSIQGFGGGALQSVDFGVVRGLNSPTRSR